MRITLQVVISYNSELHHKSMIKVNLLTILSFLNKVSW